MTDTAELFIDSRCELGEGIIWHPFQERLFWFDIINKTLYSATAGGIMVDRFTFDTMVSAAGVIDADNLAIASSEGIYKLNIKTDTRELIAPLEADVPGNRSNDGRVGPSGALWIGTMAMKDAGTHASGALYHVRGGTVTRLRADINIPNATCFSPDGRRAYFTDGVGHRIQTVSTDPMTGLPNGAWQDFAAVDGASPDGAIIDSEGFMWNAQWGGGRVVRYSPTGKIDRVIKVPVSLPTCPALGGKDLKTLYITSSRENFTPAQIAAEPLAGSVFAIDVDVPGLPEPLFRADSPRSVETRDRGTNFEVARRRVPAQPLNPVLAEHEGIDDRAAVAPHRRGHPGDDQVSAAALFSERGGVLHDGVAEPCGACADACVSVATLLGGNRDRVRVSVAPDVEREALRLAVGEFQSIVPADRHRVRCVGDEHVRRMIEGQQHHRRHGQ